MERLNLNIEYLRTYFSLLMSMRIFLAFALTTFHPVFAWGLTSGQNLSRLVGVTPRRIAVTASSVESVIDQIKSIEPSVTNDSLIQFTNAMALLSSAGPLGPAGPLGALGPLGGKGPIAGGPVGIWQQTLVEWFRLFAGGAIVADFLTLNGGPLSEAGPLGPNGPLSRYDDLENFDGLTKQLQAGGLWGVLGPLGPLGALGPLGPLGPLGAHGLRRGADGSYLSADGKVQRQVMAGGRRHDLVEVYTGKTAKGLKQNETSFVIKGRLKTAGKTDVYRFRSASDQWLTVVVVPGTSLDTFTLAVIPRSGDVAQASRLGANGKDIKMIDDRTPVVVSSSNLKVNWVQLQVRSGETITASVTTADSGPRSYRLIVVGSGPEFVDTDIRGPHQIIF